MASESQRAGGRVGPSNTKLLWRGITMGCAACGQRRGLFKWWVKMEDSCPNCGLVFGRFEGQWIGAIGINTIVSFGLLGIVMMVALALSFPNPDTSKLMILSVAVAIVTPIVLFPFSRTFWLGLDLIMTPLEPHEVDWTKVDPSLAAEAEARREGSQITLSEAGATGGTVAGGSDSAASDGSGSVTEPDTGSTQDD